MTPSPEPHSEQRHSEARDAELAALEAMLPAAARLFSHRSQVRGPRMPTADADALPAAQAAMLATFERHMAAELAGDLDTTMATMTDAPYVNHVPVLTGGVGWYQASVLVQLGLLDPAGLPVSGAESTHKVLDPRLPSRRIAPARQGAPPAALPAAPTLLA